MDLYSELISVIKSKRWGLVFHEVTIASVLLIAACTIAVVRALSSYASPQLVIAAFGDYGCQAGSSCAAVSTQQEQSVANMVLGWAPDAVVALGDNSYDYSCASGAGFPQATANNCSGTNDILNDQSPYNQPGGPIPSGIFYPAVGNHDDNFNWNNYLYGGTTPCTNATVESDVSNCSYLYDRPPHYIAHLGSGLLDLFVVNSNGHDPDGGAQSTSGQNSWYNNAVNNSTATWKIEAMHHPRWSSGEHGSNNYIDWTVNNNIDLYLAGHDHNSEHLVENGQNFVVEGTGGRNVRTGTTCIPYSNTTGVTYSADGLTITDPAQAWDKTKLAGRSVTVAGQTRNITTNTSTAMTLDSPLSPVPADGTLYTTSDCVLGSVWHDDAHFGAAKITITATQLKVQFYATDGTLLHGFSLYKGTATGSVSGSVKDSKGNPIGGAKVSYTDGDTYTDSSGNYSFSQIPTGTVGFTVSATGYRGTSQNVTVSSGSNPQDYTLASSGIIFASGFESGNTSDWSVVSANVSVCADSLSCPANSGNYSIEANTATGPAYLQENSGSSYTNLNTRMYFNIKSRTTNISMIYDRTAANGGIFHIVDDINNHIVLRNDVKSTTTTSCVTVTNPTGQWHQLETGVSIPGSGNSTVNTWLDGTEVVWPGPDATCGTGDDTVNDSEDFTASSVEPSVGGLIIGDTATTGRTFDMLMDDGAFSSTGYIGSAYDDLSGQVTSQEDGSPVNGAVINASWTFPGTSSSGSTSVTTDAGGNYSFSSANCLTNHTGCLPGNLDVTLSASDPPVYSDSAATKVFLAFNTPVTNQNIALGEAPATLSGAVTDATTGAPLSGVTILDTEGSVTSDSNGNYTQTLEPEDYVVSASLANYQTGTYNLTVSGGENATHDFALTPDTGTVNGTVTDSTTGQPVAGAKVAYSGGSTTTDSGGNYTLAGIPAEVADTVTVSYTGYANGNLPVNLTPAQTINHDFLLNPDDGTATGVIKDAVTGAKLSGVSVSYGGGSTTTDSGGNYSLSVPAETAYTMTVSLANYGSQNTALNFPPGGSLSKNFNLDPDNGSISGKVADSSGSALAGASVTYNASKTVTDAGGNYSFNNLSAEVSHTLSASLACYDTASAAVSAPPGGTGTHNLTLSVQADSAPKAALSVTPASGAVPLSVTASAAGSTDTDCHGISKYQFDFGDGTIAGPQSTPAAGHKYTKAGSYTVRVTVTDTAGLAGSAARTVTAGSTQKQSSPAAAPPPAPKAQPPASPSPSSSSPSASPKPVPNNLQTGTEKPAEKTSKTKTAVRIVAGAMGSVSLLFLAFKLLLARFL